MQNITCTTGLVQGFRVNLMYTYSIGRDSENAWDSDLEAANSSRNKFGKRTKRRLLALVMVVEVTVAVIYFYLLLSSSQTDRLRRLEKF